MAGRHVATRVLVAVLGGLWASCSDSVQSSVAPSTRSDSSQPSVNEHSTATLQLTSMGLTDGGRGADGQWLYEATIYLHGGTVDSLVTRVQIDLLASELMGTADIAPALLVAAKSNRAFSLQLTSGTHVEVGAVTAKVKIQFDDMYGNDGSVTSSFSGFGYWDY